jgi:hypothetical protein
MGDSNFQHPEQPLSRMTNFTSTAEPVSLDEVTAMRVIGGDTAPVNALGATCNTDNTSLTLSPLEEATMMLQDSLRPFCWPQRFGYRLIINNRRYFEGVFCFADRITTHDIFDHATACLRSCNLVRDSFTAANAVVHFGCFRIGSPDQDKRGLVPFWDFQEFERVYIKLRGEQTWEKCIMDVTINLTMDLSTLYENAMVDAPQETTDNQRGGQDPHNGGWSGKSFKQRLRDVQFHFTGFLWRGRHRRTQSS